MSEERFDVCFYGILQPGRERETVMANMAKLFKTEPARLAPYFAGGRKVIKAGVDEATAEKYRAALENVGLIIKIEAAGEKAPAQAAAATTGQDAAGDDKQDAGQAADAKAAEEPGAQIDTSGITVAPVGADVLENPPEVTPQPIGDISDISVAPVGADVLENPPEVTPQPIGDISDITVAPVGADVLENPPEVTPQPIGDISDITMAPVGADVLENPPPKETVPIPDTSELTLD